MENWFVYWIINTEFSFQIIKWKANRYENNSFTTFSADLTIKNLIWLTNDMVVHKKKSEINGA